MQILDNVRNTVKEDLQVTIKKGSKMSVAAACFSIYAFKELKKQLESVEELRFIFTSPTFLKEKTPKASREFYISRLNRERSIYGTEFEVKLRNELTQKAIAKECAEWIRKKVKFKSNTTGEQMMGFMTVDETSYMPFNAFTTVDLGCERGNNAYYFVQKSNEPIIVRQLLNTFEEIWNDNKKLQDVTDLVVESISAAYNENAPDFIYFFMLYNLFNEFLEDISEDVLPNDATGFKSSKIWNLLYDFQKDAALGIINKLEKYNGCILADSVGLGKTFTALSVIKYYENRNKSVLVLCPKKLSENWSTYKSNYKNNPIVEDRLRYDVLYHTDLSRNGGKSNGIDLSLINWGNYDLCVIDESHNFRNGIGTHSNTKENRYQRLMDRIVRAGVRTKVLMLSATPVNNRFTDLRNQLALAYEGEPEQFEAKLKTNKSIEDIFRNAQRTFNEWSKLPAEKRTTQNLLRALDFDFFEILDSVTIARSRKHIEKYYNTEEIGKFPERLKPVSVFPSLTSSDKEINYTQIYELLMTLNLTVYTPSNFIFDSRLDKYIEQTDSSLDNLSQRGREEGIRRLMSINLLKRLESSVYSFRLTLKRIQQLINSTIELIHAFKSGSKVVELTEYSDARDFDGDDQNTDYFTVGKKVRIDLADMDLQSWLHDLTNDATQLETLQGLVADITPVHDEKLQTLYKLIRQKLEKPINKDNKKIIIFTAFSDTADYLYKNVSSFVKKNFGLDTAEITGSVDGKTTIPKLKSDLNTVLTAFSPISKRKDILMPESNANIDVLIATDCISEGQNLQDCDYLINYDIHWNPVRIIQRFGRIDRIGSQNQYIQLVNFWPDMDLDEYINLKSRVETRMKISVMTSTGDDDLINAEEKGDLEYRREQLKRLREEVVDLEDMSNGICIMDLGLNEFRLDLLEYLKRHEEIENAPKGIHAVVASGTDAPPGVLFVLKNINESINIDHRNRVHPFYMVYISSEGEIVRDYLDPKKLLDTFRFLCKGKSEPNITLCSVFNKETKDGRDMSEVSELLSESISSIMDVKEESDIDSLFKAGGTSALVSDVSGLDDFELICFLVVR
ncbi:MAG: DEAD/DEAH box helicase family protein [Acidaminococcaceae bacterium]|nr:DEAD/DEAH box helicase family protein [Acidaminococcaceae bacterium]